MCIAWRLVSWCFWCCDSSYRQGGLSKLATYLAALYVILPQLDSIGLSGVLFLCILGVPYNFWGSSDSGHSFQFSFPEMDPFLFHFLRMLIILFLYLCVASLLSLVYVFVFVSPTMSVIFSLYSVVFMITAALPFFAGVWWWSCLFSVSV